MKVNHVTRALQAVGDEDEVVSMERVRYEIDAGTASLVPCQWSQSTAHAAKET